MVWTHITYYNNIIYNVHIHKFMKHVGIFLIEFWNLVHTCILKKLLIRKRVKWLTDEHTNLEDTHTYYIKINTVQIKNTSAWTYIVYISKNISEMWFTLDTVCVSEHWWIEGHICGWPISWLRCYCEVYRVQDWSPLFERGPKENHFRWGFKFHKSMS